MPRFRMNSSLGKSILALVRDGDYAHPGEEEAIVLASRMIRRVGIRRILDVGCGRGGTAAWFQRGGWGAVTGVDLDTASIAYARQRYPDVTFLQQDVGCLVDSRLQPFDLVYLFTSYYAFADQLKALQQIRGVSSERSQLLMVDYTLCRDMLVPPELGEEIGRPLLPDTIGETLAAAGWNLAEVADWGVRFAKWYESLLKRFQDRRSDIIQLAGSEWYEYVVRWYGALQQALIECRLGGICLTAVATAPPAPGRL